MSVLKIQDFSRDPFEYLRRLERLSRLDADRCAFIRQQRVASPVSGEPERHHSAPNVSGAPNNPEAA